MRFASTLVLTIAKPHAMCMDGKMAFVSKTLVTETQVKHSYMGYCSIATCLKTLTTSEPHRLFHRPLDLNLP